MCETATPRSVPSDHDHSASIPLHRSQRPARPMAESRSTQNTTTRQDGGDRRSARTGSIPRPARRRFPGLPSQISYARRFVARQMAESPELTTATLLTSELATNAIRHSASGCDTGKFEVCVRLAPGWARVEVRDLGSTTEAPLPQHRDPYDTAEHGRGLDLVEALASKWGTEPRLDGRGRQVWFELEWDGDGRP